MSPGPVPGSRRLALLLLLLAVAAAWLAVPVWMDFERLAAHRNPAALAGFGLMTLAPVLLAGAAARAWRRSLHGPTVARLAFCALVVCWLAYVLLAGGYVRGRVVVALCAAASAWACGLFWLPPGRPLSGGWRRLEILVCNLCLVALLAEGALRGLGLCTTSPLLARKTMSSAARMHRHAMPPHSVHLGFRCNALGFYDEEFARNERTPRAVAVLGDSFAASYVPHAYHYTTVAERALPGTAIWNLGWAALGPDEYVLLHDDYVAKLQPDALLVALFLGNDLLEVQPAATADRWLAGWFDRGSVLLCEVPRRLGLLARARAVDPIPDRETAIVTGEAALVARWPHLADPLREPGTFAPEAFLELETARARGACTPDPASLEALETRLRELRARAGKRPFGVLLLPDEFMLEDRLWQQLRARAPELGDKRQRLREHLLTFCRNEGMPHLDLLPALAAVPPLADGDRHLYLLRDTHWNARGNAVAGAALAEFLRELLR